MLGGWEESLTQRPPHSSQGLQACLYSVHKKSFPEHWREGWGFALLKSLYKNHCFSSLLQEWRIFIVEKNFKWINKEKNIKVICNIMVVITLLTFWSIAFWFSGKVTLPSQVRAKSKRVLALGKGATRCSSIYQRPVLSGEALTFTSTEERTSWRYS